MSKKQIICPKCGNHEVQISTVNEVKLKNQHHSVFWWLFIGWWWVPVKWLYLTIPALIFKLFGNKKKQKTIVNLPLNAGIVGTIVGIAAGPQALLASALVTYGLDIRIELVKTDREIVEVNAELLGEKVDDLGDVVFEKVHEVKDKLSNKE